MTVEERRRRLEDAVARTRWHYTTLSFMDAFASLGDEERSKDYPRAPLRLQAEMLNSLGEEGWDVYEIKFDESGYPLYFLRRVLDD